MNYKGQFDLYSGDRIVEPLLQTGLAKHHAIYLGVDSFGNELIAENHKQKGVQLVNARDYFSNVSAIDCVRRSN